MNSSEIFDTTLEPLQLPIFGEMKLAILKECAKGTPMTLAKLGQNLGISYQAIRKHTLELHKKGCLVRSQYVGRTGHMYMISFDGTIRHMLQTPMGIQMAVLHPELRDDIVPVKADDSAMLTTLPVVNDSPTYTISGQPINLFDLTIVMSSPGSAFATLMHAGTIGIAHIWYRSYLRTEQKVPEHQLPSPNEQEVLAFLRGIIKQIDDFKRVLFEIQANPQLFAFGNITEEDYGNWKLLGGMPVAQVKEWSEKFSTNWMTGNINHFGNAFDLAENVQNQRMVINKRLREEFERMKNAVEDSEDNP